MLITVNTLKFPTDEATAVSVMPRWHKRRAGYVLALAGRCAR
jgi:hypothetical protein